MLNKIARAAEENHFYFLQPFSCMFFPWNYIFFPACVAQPAVASNYDPIPSVADSERQGNQPVYRYNSPLENESAVALEARSADDRAGNAGYNLAIK